MGIGRPARATLGDDQLDSLFRALADRTRRALLERLARGPAMVSELAEPFAMSLPAVSKHIRILEEAGLLERSIDGRVHVCVLRAEPLSELEEWARTQRAFWDERLDRLARFVEPKR
jgi:DNA-binding transcriptional ArsR family regulator